MSTILTAKDVFEAQREALKFTWVAGRGGAGRLLELATARFPGMALVGHLNFVHPNRVQVIGTSELTYLNEHLTGGARETAITDLFSCPSSAIVIIANNETAPAEMQAAAEAASMPLFSSPLPSPRVIHDLQYYLARALAEREIMHGVFMEVMGLGVFLTGESGIGKSELALELLSRGHRLIADDACEFFRVGPDALQGRCPDMLCDFLEVRGLGILNVRTMFGETSVRHERTLHLIVRLKDLAQNPQASIDRLQAEQKTRSILGVDVAEVVLFVASGRNLAVLVEVATRGHILRRRGINALEDFMHRQQLAMKSP
ncbi:MAG TPA: HPr(Ser) kinase/phosphatase [Acidiferrobacter sp.]|nr:HPr(Ser) kinase/phosphatase [Acidiferrobacter sp.]